MNEEYPLFFTVGIVIVLAFLVGIFGSLGPVFSDWLLS